MMIHDHDHEIHNDVSEKIWYNLGIILVRFFWDDHVGTFHDSMTTGDPEVTIQCEAPKI